MNLTDINYQDVNESFGIGGPYIGVLNFKGNRIDGKFLVDGEVFNDKKDKIIFSRISNIKKKKGILNFSSVREFQIFIYDSINDKFYQSKDKFESLSIEKMEKDVITYHLAFHNSLDRFRKRIEFNLDNFENIDF